MRLSNELNGEVTSKGVAYQGTKVGSKRFIDPDDVTSSLRHHGCELCGHKREWYGPAVYEIGAHESKQLVEWAEALTW